jgi:uncharacterized membrane protein YbhN (UPF0104 family)
VDQRIKRIIKTILKFGLTIFALYFVFSKIEFKSVLQIIAQTDVFYLLIALLLFAGSKLLAALRLNMFFRRLGLDLSEKDNISLYMLGMFYNLFLPGGIGGDGYKIYLLQKNFKTGTARLFGAVLTDRLSGMLALCVLALTLFSVADIPLPYHQLGFILIPFGILAFYWFIRFVYRFLLPAFTKTTLLSFGVQGLQLICTWFIIFSLGGGDGHMLDYLLVFLVSSIVAVLPISIGGMGVRELTFLYGSQYLGINSELAVSISLLFYLITAGVSFTGLWFVIKPIQLQKQAE